MLFSLKCQFRWNGLPLDSQAAAVLSRNISHPWLTFCNIFMYYETENLESGDDSHSCSCLRWGHNDIRGNLPYHHKLCLHLIANSRNREPVSLTIFFDLPRVLLVTVWTGGGGGGELQSCASASGSATASIYTGGAPDTLTTFGYFLFSGMILDFHLISVSDFLSCPVE